VTKLGLTLETVINRTEFGLSWNAPLPRIPPFDRELPLAAAHEAFNDDGTLKDHDLTLELDAILAELLDTTRQRLAA
jgi:hypothetical protein